MRDRLKYPEIENRWQPEHDIENEGAEKFCQYNLPVTHRGCHQGFNRAELKFLSEQSHGNEWKNQNKGEPEKNRIKECFLHRIGHWPLIHERNLKIKINSAHD